MEEARPLVSPLSKRSKELGHAIQLRPNQPDKAIEVESSGLTPSITTPDFPDLEPSKPRRLAPDATGAEIPKDAVWTRINRSLVSAEVLDKAGMRYEARPDFVAVLGVLSRHQIEELTRTTAMVRAERQASGRSESSRPTAPERMDQVATTTLTAPSSAGPSAWSSLLSKITKVTGETPSTHQTSITDQPSLVGKGASENPGLATVQMEVAEPAQPPISEHDDQGSVSQGSTIYTAEQVEDVVSRFSRAVLRQLRFRLGRDSSDDFALQRLLKELRLALKVFSEVVIADGSNFAKAKSLKMIRRLRSQIARRIHEGVKTSDTAEQKRPEVLPLGDLGEMSYVDKIQVLWAPTVTPSVSGQTKDHVKNMPPPPLAGAKDTEHDPPPPPVSRPSTPTSSIASMQTDDSLDVAHTPQDRVYGRDINPTEILKTLTSDEAFKTLAKETERILDMYTCDKMNVIRQRTALSLRRSSLPRFDNSDYRAIFNVDWDLSGFLERNYERGVNQFVKKIAATTGTADVAVLCSVGDYIKSQWPKLPSILLDAISIACGQHKMFQRFSELLFLPSSLHGRVVMANSDA